MGTVLMRRATAVLGLALCCGVFQPLAMAAGKAAAPSAPGATPPAEGIEFQAEPRLAFTDSTPAKLGATKRVVIAEVVLEFQTLVAAEDITGFLSKRVLNRGNTVTRNVLAGFDKAQLRSAADKVCERLAQDLRQAGYEVVPYKELAANPTYQTLVTEMAYPQGGHWGNQDGNSIIVSPNALPLYVPGPAEAGTFNNNKNQVTPFQGESDVFNFKRAGAASYSAQREVEIAKALNAHVLKAWYLVGFGQATAETNWDSQTTRTQTYGNVSVTSWKNASSSTGATAQMYLRDEQTRIALRSPDGDTGYARSSSSKGGLGGGTRPYDGDVVLRLDEMLLGAADFLAPGSGTPQAVAPTPEAPANAGLAALAGLFGAMAGPPNSAGTTMASYTTQVDAARFAKASADLVTAVQSKLVKQLKP